MFPGTGGLRWCEQGLLRGRPAQGQALFLHCVPAFRRRLGRRFPVLPDLFPLHRPVPTAQSRVGRRYMGITRDALGHYIVNCGLR
jgi:hypothetical protein